VRGGWALALVCAALAGRALAADRPGGGAPIEWSQPAPRAMRSLLLDAVLVGDRIVTVGDRGHVVVSSDGTGWSQVPVPTRSMLTAVAAAGAAVWAVGHDAVVVHSADGGLTWIRQHAAPERDAPLLDVWFGDARRGIAVGAYGLALATGDGGTTWREVAIDPEERHLNAVGAGPHGELYVAGENGAVFRSRDAGQTWSVAPTPYSGSLFGLLVLRDGALLVFGLRGHVLRSEDGAATWSAVDTGTDATLLGGAELPGGTVVIVGLSGTILASGDGGRRFTARNRPDRHALAAALPGPRGSLLLVGEDGPALLDGSAVGEAP
jgi:photosystem II stability/assembly factor-like uncharacterized protein